MGVEEDKKDKVVRLIKEAAKKGDKADRPPKHTDAGVHNSVTVTGDNTGTTFIVNGPLYMAGGVPVPQPATQPAAVAKAGPVIDKRQANQLHKLKDQIVELETEPDKDEASKTVWRTLNRAMDVETMRDIPVDKFAHAKNYLTSWLNRLKREQTQEQITDLRAEIIADTVNETLELKVSRYIASHWPGQTVETLDDVDALTRVKRYLAALNR